MAEKIKVLVLEDSQTDAELICRLLSKDCTDFEFNLAGNKEAFLYALEHCPPSVILADNSLPQFSAREALEMVHQHHRDIPFILVTGSVSEEFAAGIIKLGADDYILKDRMIRLPTAIDTAIKQQKVKNERRLAQEGERKSNERFLTLSKATRDAIWDWDLQRDEIWWNDSFYALFGFDPSGPVPPTSEWAKRIHHADRNKVMARFKGVWSNGVPSWEDEFRLKLADGGYGTVLDRAYVLKDRYGDPVRVIGALVDITEQKKLIREMEVLSRIARETNNSVLVFNPHNGYVSWVNQAFTRYTGYTKQDLNERDLWPMLTGPETDENAVAFTKKQIETNAPFTLDLLIYAKNGEKRWQSMNGEPIKEYGAEAAGYFVIGTDISERRRMEEDRLRDKVERQREVSSIILEAQEVERSGLGRELHDNIIQILAAVNLKLGYFLEEPEDNLALIENCRLDLKKAIQEARDLSALQIFAIA